MNITQTVANIRRKYSQSNPQALRNPWIIGWITVVSVFIGVNIMFFILAVVSSPGLVVEDYYEQGRLYEKNALTLIAAHNKLNWETRLEIPESIVIKQSDVFRFSAVNERGVPIKHAAVQLSAYRPSDANADFTTALEEIAPGLYQTNISFPLQGVWDLTLKVQSGEDQYQMGHRISVLQEPG